MKTAEIKEFSTQDLVERIETEKENLRKMKLNHKIRVRLKNPAEI